VYFHNLDSCREYYDVYTLKYDIFHITYK